MSKDAIITISEWPIPDQRIRCSTCGDNQARYIDETGGLVCGTCPIKHKLDSIKVGDVPKLLAWCREVLAGGTMSETGGSSFQALREIVGRRP